MRARVLCWLAVATMVLAGVALAAVPQLMNYQGILLDGSGNPIVTPVGVVFTIYDAANGGNVKWTETRNVTPDANGRFSINLGQVDNLTEAVFAAPDRWLGIKVGADPEMVPRTRLATVPYSFRVETVDGSTGGAISGDLTVSGGNVCLDPSSATAGNILKGGVPFIHDFGIDNTFIGRNAGNLAMSGEFNTASGASALSSNTNGAGNTASGCEALRGNTIGHDNTASGCAALCSNTEGNYNTASGVLALRLNTTGTGNTASGVEALYSNTTGHDNTASGREALWSNITGYDNTASGRQALWSNTTGYDNTASGAYALQSNTTGIRNTASGYLALENNTDGNNNTASGIRALQSNTTGSGNTASGCQALKSNTTGGDNTASGNIALSGNTTGNDNTASGVSALQFNTTGSYNTAIGFYAFSNNTTGSSNTGVGHGAYLSEGNLTNATAIGAGAMVNASNKIRLGNASVSVIEGQVAYTFPSDRNEKENFRPVDGDEVLRKIRGLDLTSWNYIGHDPRQFRHYGPVAQEFFAAFGHDDVGTSGTPTTINTGDMAGILMIAVQALEKRTAEVATIKAENEDMKKQVEQLQALVQRLLDEKK